MSVSVVVFSAFFLLLRREIGEGFFQAFDLREDFCQLDGPNLLGNDLFVLIKQEHLGRSVHVEGGSEVQAFEIGASFVDQCCGTVLRIDQWVVAHIDPSVKALFSNVFLPRFGFEVIANGEDLESLGLPSFVDALQLGHFLFAVSASAFPNADQGVLGFDVKQFNPFVLVEIGERDVGWTVAAKGVLEVLSSFQDLFQLRLIQPIHHPGAVICVHQVNKHFVHAHDLGGLTGIRHMVQHVLEHVLVAVVQGFRQQHVGLCRHGVGDLWKISHKTIGC